MSLTAEILVRRGTNGVVITRVVGDACRVLIWNTPSGNPSILAHPGQFSVALLALECLAEERTDPALWILARRFRAAVPVTPIPPEDSHA